MGQSEVSVKARQLAVLQRGIDQKTADRREADGSDDGEPTQLIGAMALFEVVVGHSEDGGGYAQKSVAAEFFDDFLCSLPSGICSQHFVRHIARTDKSIRKNIYRLPARHDGQNVVAVVILDERLDLQIYPGRVFGGGRADDDQPARVFQRLLDAGGKSCGRRQFTFIEKYAADPFWPAARDDGHAKMLQILLESSGCCAVDRTVLVADECVVFGSDVGEIGFPGLCTCAFGHESAFRCAFTGRRLRYCRTAAAHLPGVGDVSRGWFYYNRVLRHLKGGVITLEAEQPHLGEIYLKGRVATVSTLQPAVLCIIKASMCRSAIILRSLLKKPERSFSIRMTIAF